MFSLRGFVMALLATVLVVGPIATAQAECSENRVMRLTRNGNSVRKIATVCKMEVEEIKDIIAEGGEQDAAVAEIDLKKDAPPAEEPQVAKLPDDEQLGPCGCWGPESFEKRPFGKCVSGYAQARICGPVCPQGGFAWYGVCTP